MRRAGEQLAGELAGLGGRAEFVRTDVRLEAEVQRLMEYAVQTYGKIDVAFNNAGTEGTPGGVEDITDKEYEEVFDTNVRGTLLSMKHEFRAMKTSGGGSIVNISSTYGQMGFPGASLYVASKHAVIGVTKVAAIEGALHGIRVNAVAPGFTRTAMYERVTASDAFRQAVDSILPLHRPGTPEEIAEAVVFLGSDKASYITGQTLTLDGGLMVGWPLFPVG